MDISHVASYIAKQLPGGNFKLLKIHQNAKIPPFLGFLSNTEHPHE